MREKIRLSDLTVLYVCLSEEWSTIERRCIADASYFRNIGGTAFILCHEKSLVDRESEKDDIPRLYFGAALTGWKSRLNFYFQIQQILLKQQIDIIHSYNFDSLLPLGMILKSLPQVPLVFTYNEFLPWKNHSFFDRWFISRTDSIFTFSPNIKELAAENFPVSARKIHVTGAGIDFPAKILRSQHPEEKKKIMTFIPRTEDDLKNLRLLVDAIPPLLHHLKSVGFNQKLIFTFLTDISWYTHPIYDGIKRMILERHLEMHISFETRPLASHSFQDCDIFIGLPTTELFSDQDLYALVTQTPVLLARTSTRQHLVKQGKFGETYHPEDGRELKDKIIKILANYSNYLEELNGVELELQEQHHFERYAEELYAHYEKLYTQRLRYTQKSKKLG
ncbi:MAG TPA: glycosyltransferase [Bacteriovoracaceae bacterium]|nr:glycosyltransferase [Bacteriovoracaceae bacterium]